MSDYDFYNATSTYTGIFAGLMAVLGIIIVISIAVAILQIIGIWKILKKGGKPGWGALIPIYNVYLLCQVSGVNPWWILIVCLSPVLSVIPILGGLAVFAISIYFTIILSVSLARSYGKEDAFAVGMILLPPIFYLILGSGSSQYVGAKPMKDIIFNKNNTTNNKNNNNFAGGQPNTNNNNYAGDQFNNNNNNYAGDQFNNNNNNFAGGQPNINTDVNSVSTNNATVKYCSSCGSQVDSNTRFCPNCGKENI